MKQYKIHLEPEDGLTLSTRTEEEWDLGYTFRVLWSDSPIFRTGSRITSRDLKDQEQYHPVVFRPSFKTLSVEDYVSQEAEHDYGFEQCWEGLKGE